MNNKLNFVKNDKHKQGIISEIEADFCSNIDDAYDIVRKLGDVKISGVPSVEKKQMELFEKNLNPRNVMRFNASTVGTQIESTNGVAHEVNSGQYAPVALRNAMPAAQPHFMNSEPGNIRIQHREMITSVMGSVVDSFTHNYRIQPGNKGVFPWLSKIANLFESYTFHMLRVIYVPRVPTSTAGQIGLALDFDADDTPATSLQEFSQYRDSTIGSVWSGLELLVEGEALLKCVKERYVDHVTAPHTYDPLLHDVANLRVAVLSAMSDADTLGQIYVEYDITLRTPEPNNEKSGITMVKLTGSSNTLNKPFGGNSTYPTLTCHIYDVPIDFKWDGVRNCIRIKNVGRFKVGITKVIDHVASEWDTAEKCFGNNRFTFAFSAAFGSTVACTGGWPLNEVYEEVHCASLTDYFTANMLVDIKDSEGWFYVADTAGSGAGISTNTAAVVYLTIEAMDGQTYMPTIETFGYNPVLYESLTPQQKRNPLGARDNKSRRSIIALAKALHMETLPPLRRIGIKIKKHKSAKKDRKKPNKSKK